MTNTASRVSRILFKEIVDGDVIKIHADSNDSDSGGGARDFRFGSYSELEHIFHSMFPSPIQDYRRRSGVTSLVTIYSGYFYWQDPVTGQTLRQISYFEPPTDARPQEGRITKIHEHPCLSTALMPNSSTTNRVFLLLTQMDDGTVWPSYVEERTLRSVGLWANEVTTKMLNCIDSPRRANQSVIGYYDFTTHDRYCN
ncbi:hypothetical protein B9J96_03140 [Enterobacter roggenkampii]|uniref:hypothetical protein n=1 Tax=Enterobacter roggenkampii TaxID=1812935 RepID=UPI000B3B9A12|nr:hypothetical protein [Enterobacter roggenkampii]OUR39183.1 hypothetical protein B9J96_03140 [Enterobacter roggenkampii]